MIKMLTTLTNNKWVTPYRITVLIALSLLVIGTWVTIVFLRTPVIPAAVTTYESPIILSNYKPLCPGDKVVYDQRAHFTDAPVTVVIAATVWSLDHNVTVISDRMPTSVNYTVPTIVELHGEWVIPKDLPPGNYERRLIGTASGHRAEGFVVPFTVADHCPAK